MELSEADVQKLVERVVARVSSEVQGRVASRSAAPAVHTSSRTAPGRSSHGVFGSVADAIAAAEKSFDQLRDTTLELRGKMIEAMRRAADAANQELAEFAVRETGLGRVEDKVAKNRNAIWQTPGLEDIRAQAVTGDHGLMLTDYAPYGVIGSITPRVNSSMNSRAKF